MPRRRFPRISLPRRPDRRRLGGNTTDAQRPARRGQTEVIAERRARAFELRKAGGSFREIARRLGVDVHTAHADIDAELAVLREGTVEHANQIRELELQRCDEMTAGLWPKIRAGSPPAVSAAIRVSERRSRLLGLDAPVATRSEFAGSLGVHAENLAAERELLRELSLPQLEELAEQSQALIDRAMAMANENARKARMLVDVSPAPVPNAHVVATGELPEQPPSSPSARAILSVAARDGVDD